MGPQNSRRDFDIEQLNKCTLCPFSSHMKSSFQRHLMKHHGIKLKGFETYAKNTQYATMGRIANNYGSNDKAISRRREQPRRCPKCNKLCTTGKYYRTHVEKCVKGSLISCPKCQITFEKQSNLYNHMQKCGKELRVVCQLCDFKSLGVDRMQRHYMNKHNLICRPVMEPDFDQALNGTPYFLERPIELENLPSVDEVTMLQTENDAEPIRFVKLDTSNSKKKTFFSCHSCKKEFTKERFRNAHVKRGCK